MAVGIRGVAWDRKGSTVLVSALLNIGKTRQNACCNGTDALSPHKNSGHVDQLTRLGDCGAPEYLLRYSGTEGVHLELA